MTLTPAPACSVPRQSSLRAGGARKDSPWRLTVAISWNPSRGATLGIEWEIQLIDCRSRMLRQDSRKALAALPALSEGSENPKTPYELMQSTGQVVNGMCTTQSEANSG